uniref:Centrosomal protein 128 n=1 Tax=Myripristis murdjan TaxID=586833 RepID=A0A667XX08_9TELE
FEKHTAIPSHYSTVLTALRDSQTSSAGCPRSFYSSLTANLKIDTSRNLNKVDRMLGQYTEHADDQAEAMALLKENLEESISQLQAQRLSRSLGARSASASTLHTSDLEACSGSGRRNETKALAHQGQAEKTETEALLQESTRSRDELKTRAQEAVRQWRAKCRRLQKELDEARAQSQLHTNKATQLKALSQQTEAVRRELTEILGRLAQREEELHRKDVELSETCQRQLSLEEASSILKEQAKRQAVLQAQLREENQRLEERTDTQSRRSQMDQVARAELQASLKELTSAHAQLAQQLAEEESSKKELQKGNSELQAKLTVVQEERASLGQQLQLEREVHQKELANMKAMMENSRTKKDRELQDTLRLCQEEREEIQAHIKEVKVAHCNDVELCGALQIKLDRMKDECDKLAEQLSTKEKTHALLQRKYQLLKKELDDKVKAELVMLRQKVLRMEAEQEAVLSSVGEELDTACCSLARDGEDKLQTKLRWLCEEVRDRDTREQRLRKQHQQMRDQLKALRQSRDSDQAALLQRLDKQEDMLNSLSTEKKELLERSRRREEEMRNLQSTKVALDHLESVPGKPCLMENFKDLEESQRQREMVQQRYSKYKEIVWDLQHQLDESKRRVQEYRVCYTHTRMHTLSRSHRSVLSSLDMDSLTLKAAHESSSPTQVPVSTLNTWCYHT